MNEPMVSVVVPTYNRKDWITQCLNSVFLQTYKNIQIIIVDDGSTDDTRSVVKDLIKKQKTVGDVNYKYFQFNSNHGIPNALNMGYSLCDGEFICQLSSDDTWKFKKIENQVEIMKDKTIGMIYSNYWFCDYTEHPFPKMWEANVFNNESRVEMFKRMINDCFMNACTFLMRREFKKEIGEYPLRKEFEWNQDLWFNFQAIMNTKWKLHYMDEATANITIHNGQASKQGKCGLGNNILIPEMIIQAKEKGWIL